jgi:hypothetical protein
VIGRLPGERSCLSLVWAVWDRAARGWRGVVMTPAAVRLLQELRRQLHHPSRLEEVVDQPVTPAAYHAPSGARGGPRPPAFHHKRDAIPGEDAQPEAAENIHASTATGTQTVGAGRRQPADRWERPMTVRFQLVIDCADPDLLARFWAAALGYELEPPPTGFASWDDYWRDVGVPEADLGIGADCIIDPDGGGPRIWFQVVPERKTVKNRLHLDVHVSGGRAVPIQTRRQRVDAEARRLADLGATMVGVLSEESIDHYGVAMNDPEGNEFDIN